MAKQPEQILGEQLLGIKEIDRQL